MSSPKMKNSCSKSTGAGSKNMTKQCSRVNMFGALAMAKSHTGLTPYKGWVDACCCFCWLLLLNCCLIGHCLLLLLQLLTLLAVLLEMNAPCLMMLAPIPCLVAVLFDFGLSGFGWNLLPCLIFPVSSYLTSSFCSSSVYGCYHLLLEEWRKCLPQKTGFDWLLLDQ